MIATLPHQAYADACAISQQLLTAVQPDHTVKQQIARHGRQLTLGPVTHHLDHGRLFVLAVGKAAYPMAQAAVAQLGDAIYHGLLISKHAQPTAVLPHFQTYLGEHPVTGPGSLAATTAVQQCLREAKAGDTLLCLLSGGASALLSQPRIPLSHWQQLTQALLASGCPINDFNTVRRQLDAAKGGGLAHWAAPAQVVTLILSDVVGNDLQAIGSGPTSLSHETAVDAQAILDHYQIAAQLDTAVYQTIQQALQQHQPPTWPASTPAPINQIIGSVVEAAQAGQQAATAVGWQTAVLTTHLEGEARQAGFFAAALAKDLPPGHCLILGGETTVTLQGNGIGGRNSELALAAAIHLTNWPNRAIFTLATDGDDGPTGAAGAVVTGQTVANGRSHQLDAAYFLNNNDSYTFFNQLQLASDIPCLLRTGPSGTNVNDLVFIIHYPENTAVALT